MEWPPTQHCLAIRDNGDRLMPPRCALEAGHDGPHMSSRGMGAVTLNERERETWGDVA